MRFFKKASGLKTISYAEALEAALCYGWIDGQIKKYDDTSWVHKFSPRRHKSTWSKRNTEHIARLIEAKRMQPAGLAQVEAAKADGRWAQAYDPPSQLTIPEDFLEELAKHPQAETFFKTLNRANLYAIAWRLQTAKKPETRTSRIQKTLEMLEKGEAFHA